MSDIPVKFQLGDTEYETNKLSENGKSQLSALKFVDNRLEELRNNVVLLNRAKASYLSKIKKEILASKAGLLLGD